MAFELFDTPTQGGGWFKPTEELKSYAAFLIETEDWEPQRPGAFGPKDSALVNLTIFATQAALEAGEPTEIKLGTRIEYTALTAALKGMKGKPVVKSLDQAPPSKPGQKPAWVWRDVTPGVKKLVAAYGAKREAAIEAALADAPSFD
jgi:hypothetical protein